MKKKKNIHGANMAVNEPTGYVGTGHEPLQLSSQLDMFSSLRICGNAFGMPRVVEVAARFCQVSQRQ